MNKHLVCSSDYLFHYLMNPEHEDFLSFYRNDLRPLSDFPDSQRWKQVQEHMPGFYEQLYRMIAEPILQKPYLYSGIFVTPIDFRLLPGSYLEAKARFRFPINRIDSDLAVITYVLDDQRVTLPFSQDNLAKTAELWDGEMITKWFGVDKTKVFFYVPQVAVYQPSIQVEEADFEGSPTISSS